MWLKYSRRGEGGGGGVKGREEAFLTHKKSFYRVITRNLAPRKTNVKKDILYRHKKLIVETVLSTKWKNESKNTTQTFIGLN
jgi:hypothetical protein